MLNVLQANLQHAKAASAEIQKKYAEGSFELGLIQEPWIHKNKIAGLNIKNCKLVYDKSADTLRAKDIIFLHISEFTDKDTATIIVKRMGMEVIITSAYYLVKKRGHHQRTSKSW